MTIYQYSATGNIFGNTSVSISTRTFTYQTPEDTQLFIISGSALEAYSTQTPEDTQLFIISGSALEVYSAQTPEDLVLYTFSGSALESFTPATYTTSGTLVSFGEKLESIDYSYNEDSISANEGLVPFGRLTLSGAAITQPNYRLFFYGTSLERETNSYVGVGTLEISGSALESFSAQTPGDTQLFSISGSALEAYSAQTPEDTQLFIISGSALEREINSYSDPTIIPYSEEDFGLTSNEIISSENYGDFFSITESDDYESILTSETLIPFGTLTLSGELVHPDIDYTPHYGIEKNIGIGTTGIQLSGKLVERETHSYVGTGTLFNIGIALERETNSYVGLGNLTLSGSALEAYSSQTQKVLNSLLFLDQL
jgi:hypothetical protein